MIGADSDRESLRQVVDRARHERRRGLAARRALDLVEALLETRKQHLIMPALVVVEANSIAADCQPLSEIRQVCAPQAVGAPLPP